MQALREFRKVVNGQLIINLPKDFDGEISVKDGKVLIKSTSKKEATQESTEVVGQLLNE